MMRPPVCLLVAQVLVASEEVLHTMVTYYAQCTAEQFRQQDRLLPPWRSGRGLLALFDYWVHRAGPASAQLAEGVFGGVPERSLSAE